MRVKKYLVNSIEEAEASILKDLGSTAIILSTRPLVTDNSTNGNGSKIEVIAGAEFPAEEKIPTIPVPSNPPSAQDFLKTLNSLESFFDLNSGEDEPYSPYANVLIEKGISPFLARSLLKSIQGRYGVPFFKNAEQVIREVKRAISGRIQTTGPILLRQDAPQMVALVGPPGTGKTTTLMKLALQYRDTLAKNVGIIAHGLHQPEAETTLNALCARHELEIKNTVNSHTLLEALDSYREQDLILIDTPGQYYEEALTQLSSLKGLQIHVVLNASVRDVESHRFIKEYKPYDPAALIFTKMDQVNRFGSIYNLCEESSIPVSYVSNGTAIPQDLEIADPVELTNLILS